MNRRTLLRNTAAAGVALSLSGCLRRGEDEDALSISASDTGETEDGNLVVTVTVSNPTDREASGTLYVNSQLDDEALTRVREVSLEPHSTTTVRVEYDVQYRNISSFSYNTDLVED
jgi:LEA14-like dessication related protein